MELPVGLDTARFIKEVGLVPIVRGDYGTRAIVELVDILYREGIPVVEITLNSAGALQTIGALREQFASRVLVGAGTVRTVDAWESAVQAGAQFTIAPNLDLGVVAAARSKSLLHLPGIFTASEAHAAFAAGCRMVKLFPSDVVGPGYLKALRAPLDDLEFVPTGGITAENLGQYVRAGAVAVGIGSALVSTPLPAPEVLTARARALRAAWDQAKHG